MTRAPWLVTGGPACLCALRALCGEKIDCCGRMRRVAERNEKRRKKWAGAAGSGLW